MKDVKRKGEKKIKTNSKRKKGRFEGQREDENHKQLPTVNTQHHFIQAIFAALFYTGIEILCSVIVYRSYVLCHSVT
jgi:hypothetical protein